MIRRCRYHRTWWTAWFDLTVRALAEQLVVPSLLDRHLTMPPYFHCLKVADKLYNSSRQVSARGRRPPWIFRLSLYDYGRRFLVSCLPRPVPFMWLNKNTQQSLIPCGISKKLYFWAEIMSLLANFLSFHISGLQPSVYKGIWKQNAMVDSLGRIGASSWK